MGNLGATEIILIFLVILLLFGAKRIPEIARGLGKGIREFKDASTDIRRELTIDDAPRYQAPQQPALPRDQRAYDPQAYNAPATLAEAYAAPAVPEAPVVHPAYGTPDPSHPAYGPTGTPSTPQG